MTATDIPFDPVTNVTDAEDHHGDEAPWGATWKCLTPHMRGAGGSLGVSHNTLGPGRIGGLFHWHLREDEVFYVLSGRGVLRYGDTQRAIGPGDCISCPAGTHTAHQIANPFDEDLVYLGIGPHDPHEVCGYPDSGKVLVRGMNAVGHLNNTSYIDGEPNPPIALSDGDNPPD